ncbi:DNA polymerase-3 subunit epsilon [Allocatelliglobosispora scoriae]|uniref:DNA polymerase-3 subunit epsilon n=1 Tax=Allocatelliglobosispora scoriae TaxID=643052 RepID=A0A841BRN1_9ACTN|nr:DEDD exonuclease domain-containing protein [Allocatelliglobosispora scoriae]MBB5869461.1 DNA polymerase-3 subunit epsilon [Allocatelliglobosispora scoriae]
MQLSFDDLLDDPRSRDLFHTTFVVLDLETTGGSPHDADGITEIGAVRVRGGEQLGTFATLVNPGSPLPPFITVLTGITQAMLAPAPRIEAVLPALLEFIGDAVFVAHNAPYDVGFLKAACARHGYPWPVRRVLDTAALARRVFTRDEVPNRKLSTLARYLRTPHQPNHRALEDALTTVDLLHAMIGRLGGHRVHTLGDAIEFSKPITPEQRAKRTLADGLPHAPGVYVFRAADDRPLYVGTSQDIATRVRTYFTAGEKRARISEMIRMATRVEAVTCAHALEAQVRELRLIATHAPPYNRRSKFPERVLWLKLTHEHFPRLSVVRQLADDGATYLGPFGGRRAAEAAAAACHEVLPIRQCTPKLSLRVTSPACALAELGRCPAPCEHKITPEVYAETAAHPFRQAVTGDPGPIVEALLARLRVLAAAERFEEAAALRERLTAFLRAVVRMQRLSSLTGIEELVAARLDAQGGWEIAIIRWGRLAAAALSPRGTHPRTTLDQARLTAEAVSPGHGPVPAATAEETERVLDWLERPETRLVEASSGWGSPVGGAARFRTLLGRLDLSARTTE